MFYILFASRGLKSAHSNSQYSNDSLHVGSSFLPFPSEHFRRADLLFFPPLWNREVFFSTFTLWKYKITQGLSYFQRAEATLASEKSVKSWLIFFFFKCYNENMYKTYPPGLSLWMLVKKKKVDEVRRARGRLRKWESISVAGFFFSYFLYLQRNPFHLKPLLRHKMSGVSQDSRGEMMTSFYGLNLPNLWRLQMKS